MRQKGGQSDQKRRGIWAIRALQIRKIVRSTEILYSFDLFVCPYVCPPSKVYVTTFRAYLLFSIAKLLYNLKSQSRN